MNKKIGFIGTGNMGQAMIGGILKAKLVESSQIIISDLDMSKLDKIEKEYNVKTTTDSIAVAQESDMIILTLKPNVYDSVLSEIKNEITEDKIIITVAAGKTIESIESILGENAKIVRTMPNTPALVGEGMTALCHNKNVTKYELREVKSIFESFGEAEVLDEGLINAVIGVSGSSPAYVFLFIEAMADAVVCAGMPRDKAYKFAAQSVLGAAKMVLETGRHPGDLKDMVCSPGGTTIEAIASLEKTGFRGSVIEGVRCCIEKANNMSLEK